jgi:hypothetical protein
MLKRQHDYATGLLRCSDEDLVDLFNRDVGNAGWVAARAAFSQALITEFRRRGIDVSSVRSQDGTSYTTKVKLQKRKLVLVSKSEHLM